MYPTTIRDLVTPKNCNFEAGTSALSDIPTAVNNVKKCCCVAELLKKIVALRRRGVVDDGEFAVITNIEIKWARLFMEFILGTTHCKATKCQAHHDDMIWYVHHTKINNSFYVGQNQASLLQVFRRQSKNQPAPGDNSYNWEETVSLNVILQQLDFFVTCAICTKTAPQNLQIIKKNCQRVYPSPSRRRMDSKGEAEEITYPKIYFAIDGFEEVFNDVIVRDGECVCVELVARDRSKTRESVVFLGSIRYEVLKRVYDSKASATWTWAQRIMKAGGRRQEFVRMRGPQGKGYAEMAIARVPNCGYETPLTETPMEFPELAEMDNTLRSRRMSETNLLGPQLYSRPSVTTPGPPHSARGRRWQSDADAVNQYPEVEGNNIDEEFDEGVLSRLWGVRGFGQAWHWLREKKRAECTPLNAYLTYVTLPWTSILNDLLSDDPRTPILTFEFDSEPQMRQ